MYHIVYLTTNIINGKFYVGKRTTENLNDGYLGSGTILKRAIKKYGKENFKRQILYYCLTSLHAYEIEAKIVNQLFVDRKDTYNMKLGGEGGLGSLRPNIKGKTYDELYGEEKSKVIKYKLKVSLNLYCLTLESKIQKSIQSKNNWKNLEYRNKVSTKISKSLTGHIISKETKEKISKGTSQAQLGKPHKDSRKKSISDGLKLMYSECTVKWYNDGIRNYRLKDTDPKIQTLNLICARLPNKKKENYVIL